jgi:hypothetical protein
MPSPGAGSVTSLSYMAQFLRSKSNNPSQGFASGAAQRDGYRVVPAADELAARRDQRIAGP